MTDEASKRAQLREARMKLAQAQGEASLTAALKSWQDQRRRVADFRCTLDARLS